MSAAGASDLDLLLREVDAVIERIAAARAEIGSIIMGQSRAVDLSLAVLLAGGHGLLIGSPASPRRSLSKRSASSWGSTPAGCSSRPI